MPSTHTAWVKATTHRAHTFEDVFGAAPALAAWNGLAGQRGS
ncbi:MULTISPECIES: hypothetical protein [Streptomyces]|nr:hypothetical protein [Streptomyces ruber]